MKTTEEMIEVMKAFEDGKKIECVNKNGLVIDTCIKSENTPSWNWLDYDYFVKKELKYRPYKDTEEMINDFCNRFGVKRASFGEPFIWIKNKGEKVKRLISAYNEDDNRVCILSWLSLEYIFINCTYLDGSPCGIKD